MGILSLLSGLLLLPLLDEDKIILSGWDSISLLDVNERERPWCIELNCKGGGGGIWGVKDDDKKRESNSRRSKSGSFRAIKNRKLVYVLIKIQ